MKRIFAAAMLSSIAFGTASAQDYPNKPVRIVVPYVAGGTVDLVARVLAQRLSEQMGQPFIVDNKPGANGTIGSDAVAKARPDGYTLLVQSPTLIASPPDDQERPIRRDARSQAHLAARLGPDGHDRTPERARQQS